jgi:microcystin-dependent protein
MKQNYFLTFLCCLFTSVIFAQDPFMAEIKIFAGDYEPSGWVFCDGRVMPIQQNMALFSLLGTTYGGNGTTNFALPDLRERVAIGSGQGSGLSTRALGEVVSGQKTVTLLPQNLPAHTHVADIKVSSAVGTSSTASNSSSLAAPVQVFNGENRLMLPYNASAGNITTNSASFNTSVAGASIPLNIEQPYLMCNYIICVNGVFPSRP